jgi:hypothetical protein
MSVEMCGSVVVRIPVPETLMKMTPVMTVMIPKDSSLVFRFLCSADNSEASNDALLSRLESSIDGLATPLVLLSWCGSSTEEGAVAVIVVMVLMTANQLLRFSGKLNKKSRKK